MSAFIIFSCRWSWYFSVQAIFSSQAAQTDVWPYQTFVCVFYYTQVRITRPTRLTWQLYRGPRQPFDTLKMQNKVMQVTFSYFTVLLCTVCFHTHHYKCTTESEDVKKLLWLQLCKIRTKLLLLFDFYFLAKNDAEVFFISSNMTVVATYCAVNHWYTVAPSCKYTFRPVMVSLHWMKAFDPQMNAAA